VQSLQQRSLRCRPPRGRHHRRLRRRRRVL